MRIILIGFMGAGKSTVGALLSRMLGLELIEIDDLVSKRSGFGSIAELVDKAGEGTFREIESAVVSELANRQEVVISTGGGVIGRTENRSALLTPGTVVVYLKTSFATSIGRIPNPEDRPLLRDKEKAEQLFDDRQNVYEAWATFSVDTDTLTAEQVTLEIATKLSEL